MWPKRQNKVHYSPVLVMDSLGFSNQIRKAGDRELLSIWNTIEKQYHRFRCTVPHKFIFFSESLVFGTREFETIRLNDMFILYSRKAMPDATLRYLVSASLLYQSMLLEGFIPRGGLGFGPLIKGKDLLIGNGFINAYEHSERREIPTKDICAVQVSPTFMSRLKRTEREYRLLCFYQGCFFIHPYYLSDPSLGTFNKEIILSLLSKSGANDEKLSCTERFLDRMEDFDDALKLNSESRKFLKILDPSQR